MSFEQEYSDEKIVEENKFYSDEKTEPPQDVSLEEEEVENSKIEAVRLVVPVTDDPTLPVVTFRFWVFSLLFSVLGSIINQYYFFRSTQGAFSIFFVNLSTYGLGTLFARHLPTRSFSIGGYSMSLNPGPFNIKEHALIGVAVNTASATAYGIEVLACMDLYLHHRLNTFAALALLITTQCLGYGMAGMLRKYLLYPAEMVYWGQLVNVVFFNAIHNTDEFKNRRMVRGWSYMKFFWVICGCMFLWEFVPQLLAPALVYIDWICWIKPYNFDIWAISSSISGGGLLSLSLDWTTIGGGTLYYPFYAQMCGYGGFILSYWIILPALWLTNTLKTKTYAYPLTSHLFYGNGTPFEVQPYLEPDFTLNGTMYDLGDPVQMTPMYALNFFYSFVSLGACITHVLFFHGRDALNVWKSLTTSKDEDIHTKMMRVYPEVPHWWYGAIYAVMFALSIVVCECYGLEVPWWALIVGLVIGWAMTFPIVALYAITSAGLGLNVISELVCGYMLPGKAIANMTFKCYCYMSMAQCSAMLEDLKLGHYMKIPPRAMFVAQLWGTVIGAVFNYFTMIVIINAHRPYLDDTVPDPNGLWTGYQADIYWGSALIFGALGPRRMFDTEGPYGFIFYGFLVGAVFPIIIWALTKKFPSIDWQKFNVAIIVSAMSACPNGYTMGLLPQLVVCLIFQWYIWRYHKNWWKKYVFILSAALDTGAAFTGLVIFFFLGGGVSPKLSVSVPSWWGNYYNATDQNYPNAPFLDIDRCGAANGQWTGGLLDGQIPNI